MEEDLKQHPSFQERSLRASVVNRLLMTAGLFLFFSISFAASLPAQAQGKKGEKAVPRAEKKAGGKKAEAADREKPASRPPYQWYSRSFAGRRSVTFEKEPARGDIALLLFGTAGLTRPDGRDIRIVADHKVPLPLEVLEIGPGDRAMVQFEAPEPGHELHLYLGNPVADPPRRPGHELRGGLRMELRALAEGDAGSWAEMAKLLKASGEPLGILLPETIQLGVPPLGRARDYLARYLGNLRVEKPGEYLFETASDGPSFVLVDGKPVAAWPGFHDLAGYADPKRRKEHSGTVVLKDGIHSLEYLVATRRGGVHVLGMQEPGQPFARAIPPARLVPWVRARPGALEAFREAAADFYWRTLSDSGSDVERHELAQLEFEWTGDLAGRVLRDVEWDFGDGQRGRGATARHVYLGHGIFTVTVTATAGPGKVLEATRRVAVRFESLRVHDLNRILEEYFRTAREFDLSRLSEEHLTLFLWLAKKDFAWEEDLFRAIEVYFSRGFSLAREEVARDGLRRARRLVQELEGLDRAEGILERVAGEAPKVEDRRDAQAWLARSWMLRTEGKRKEAEAEAALRRLLAEAGSSDPGRRAGIFLADLVLARGTLEEARKILAEMEEGPYRRFEGERQVASGARALGFDNLLRRGSIREAREELDRWDWDLPLDRLGGQVQLRRAALLRKEKKHDAALRELEQVLALSTAANQIPRALILQAEVLEEKGDREGARLRLERVVKEFPGRPERAEAERRLKEAGK